MRWSEKARNLKNWEIECMTDCDEFYEEFVRFMNSKKRRSFMCNDLSLMGELYNGEELVDGDFLEFLPSACIKKRHYLHVRSRMAALGWQRIKIMTEYRVEMENGEEYRLRLRDASRSFLSVVHYVERSI